jgi:hypothetical protein
MNTLFVATFDNGETFKFEAFGWIEAAKIAAEQADGSLVNLVVLVAIT